MNFFLIPIIFVLLINFLQFSTSYRILCLFPHPTKSHNIVFQSVTDALAERGHELVIATAFPYTNQNSNITYIDWSETVSPWKEVQFNGESQGLLMNLKRIKGIYDKIFKIEFEHPKIQSILQKKNNSEKFDLVISENHVPVFFNFAKILKTPLIVICSSDADPHEHQAVGNVVNYIAAPFRIHPYLPPMNIKERFLTVSVELLLQLLGNIVFDWTPLMKENFGEVLRYQELMQKIDLLLINTHPMLSSNRPITSKTIPLGFLHIKEPKPLPEELNHYLNQSERGVIYCSFGTHVQPSKMTPDRINALMNAFRELSYDVLFKYEGKHIENLPENVKIMKWIPQNDLLANEKVVLFITHAGQHSIEEAIMNEKPLLALPVQGDQHSNGKRIEKLGFGKWLNFKSFTSKELEENIMEVLNNKTYLEKVRRLRRLVKDQPMSSLEKAVWWIEYTMRNNGTDHLKYFGVEVPFYQYYYLDVGLIYLGIGFIIIGMISMMFKTIKKMIGLIRNVWRNKEKVQ